MLNEYPNSVADVLDDRMTFHPATLHAVREFARSRPWRGSLQERQDKFRSLHRELCGIYGIAPRLVFGNDDGDSARSCFIPVLNSVILRGRLSVVTYLHEIGHARGKKERETCAWSLTLFRRCFPKSWSRARWEGHMIRKGDIASP